jgi:hypothetical protein
MPTQPLLPTRKGVQFSRPITDEGFGLLTAIKLYPAAANSASTSPSTQPPVAADRLMHCSFRGGVRRWRTSSARGACARL